ncbi:hypothetical protein LTR78_006168 [Recurvomyces mirabilis]|uniref:Suppressor of anucleate metulae protein B n=1 Tax=Recurvomyces mirabilis TaxID=574656 RepID=A0AAE0WLM5_9PEZI|nr:hypothetical protein LTR78_006168 [Recurvomyces mirabilis]KAK5152010.1 hypothetical protein LTS14_008784 [Recurvomyces mirabilis]
MACSRCGRASAVNCEKCAEGLEQNGEPSQILYCGRQCLEADKKAHASDCGLRIDRLQLFRAGKLVQDAFLQSREQPFDLCIESVKKNGHRLIMKEPKVYKKNGPIYFEFPNEMFDNERDKKAMLTWMTCSDGLAQMFNLLEAAVQGLFTKASEVCLQLRAELARIDDGSNWRLRWSNGG